MTEMLTRPPSASKSGTKSFTRSRGLQKAASRVVLYGEGGIGKTELTSLLPGVVFIDLERGSGKLDVERIDGIDTWADMLTFLRTGDMDGIKAIAIDTGTAAEELCIKHVLDTVVTGKGKRASSIKDYGWGDGFTYVFEEWRKLLAALDVHYKAGRSVVLICHARTGRVPNPTGEDYIRFEPRLMTNNQVNIMASTVEWSDHTLFLGYDINVSKDGIAEGGTTRTLHTVASATHIAKNRNIGITEPMPLEKNDGSIWTLMNQNIPASTAPDLD